MITITIKNDKNISRTTFENIDDLLAYFLGEKGYGTLLPLDKKDISSERKNRFGKVLNTPKSQMLNI